MMKSFFKKLAFVMALAMVVSLAAPAAKTAVAAEEKPLAITYQNEKHYQISEVHLAMLGAQEDLKFLWAPTNWKELGWKWTSSNENVVAVDEVTGLVTAVAAGTATVSVAVGTESAEVKVTVAESKEKLPRYDVTLGTDDKREMTEETLEIGKTVDLKFFGVLDYSRDDIINGITRYNCSWTSSNPAVATVDMNTGLVTAVAAGSTVISLTVTNYKTGVPHNVKACTIIVPEEEAPAPDMVVINEFAEAWGYANTEVNTTQNQVVIKFAKATEIEADDVTVFEVYDAYDDDKGVGEFTEDIIEDGFREEYVKSVTANDDTKTLYTITMLEDFENDMVYDIRIGNENDPDFREWFTASVDAVAKVIVKGDGKASLADDEQALAAVPETLSVKLYDAEGVDVTTRKVNGLVNNDPANISYELKNEGEFVLYDNEIEFYEKETALVVGIYDNYDVEDPIESAVYNVTPKTNKPYGVERVIDWTIIEDNGEEKPDWSAPVKSIPAGEEGYVVVTLLEDSRGQYYCTHIMGTKDKYNGKDVWFTEDESKPFWLNGLYVEYKAQDEDMMLIDIDGEVASFEIEGQKNTRARFALYLYNQNNYGTKEFIEEQHTEYVTICHPKQLVGISVAPTTVNLMKHTEGEDCFECATTVSADAYYTEFSKDKVKVTLLDIHKDSKGNYKKADLDEARNAEFSVKLLTDTTNAALLALMEDYEDELLGAAVEHEFVVELKDFVKQASDGSLKTVMVKNKLTGEMEEEFDYITSKSQIKFRITEETTGKSVIVTVNLKDLVQEKVSYKDENDVTVTLVSDVDLIEEFVDEMKSKRYFEKFVIEGNKSVTVEQQITDYKNDKSIDGYEILLVQQDKAGNKIGYENNLLITTKDIRNNAHPTVADLVAVTGFDHAENDEVSVGDRVMILIDKAGNVLPLVGTMPETDAYKNPIYKDLAEDSVEADDYTNEIGITIKKAGDAVDVTGATTTTFTQYGINFRTLRDAGDLDKEIIYAKEGTYTAIIRTIESIAEGEDDTLGTSDDVVTFASATGLNDKVVYKVVNSNPDVFYNGRDLSLKEAPLTDYIVADDIRTVTIGTDEDVKELILEAFNFRLGKDAWAENWVDGATVDGNGKLDKTDILYYTYTLAPTNNQININSVTFKVPVMGVDNKTDDDKRYGWYRSTATVNKSITFEEN